MFSFFRFSIFLCIFILLLNSVHCVEFDESEDEDSFFLANVRDRKLVSEKVTATSIIGDHIHPGTDVASRSFIHPTLAYVTHW